jgi:hypothetical protein
MTDIPRSFAVACCDDLLRHIAACHAVLAEVQWEASDQYGLGVCPECWQSPKQGHAPGCALRACLEGRDTINTKDTP